MVKKVYVRAPASIGNMGSGFDCAGLSLKLYNGFTVERSKKAGIEFSKPSKEVSSEMVFSLFCKAFNLAIKNIGETTFPVKLTMENNIPFKRGFGSSATVILGGAISALLLTGRKVIKEEILRISLLIEGHIDNLAASLYGGFVIGRQDTLTVIYVPPPEKLTVAAFIPDKGLSTKAARDILPDTIPLSDVVYNISSVGLLCASFFLKKTDLLKFALNDKIHQPYRIKIMPHIKTLLNDKKPASSIGGCLSGAGPSVVFFAEKEISKNLFIELDNIVKQEGLKGEVHLFSPGGKVLWKVLQ